VYIVPHIMNLLRKPVTKYLGEMNLSPSALKAANEAVTAPNSSITSIDVLQNYINNQINMTITNELDGIWVNASALLWKGVSLIWDPIVAAIVTSIDEIPFVGPILGEVVQEVADLCYNKIQAYVNTKFLNPLAAKVRNKIVNTIMGLTIKVEDAGIKKFDPSGTSDIAKFAENAAQSLIRATLGPVQTQNAALGTDTTTDTSNINSNGNTQSAEASNDDSNDLNNEDGEDSTDSDTDNNESDS